MSLKTVFTLNTIAAGFFALVTLLIPSTMLSWYGTGPVSDTTILMTRFFGVPMLGMALLTFFLKDAELSKDMKSVVLALMISAIVGFIVALWCQYTNQFNNLGWLNVIIYGFFSIALYLVYKKK